MGPIMRHGWSSHPSGRVAVACLLAAVGGALADWPQVLGPERDGRYRDGAPTTTLPKDGPVILWRRDVGSGFAGPAVADGPRTEAHVGLAPVYPLGPG